MTPDYVVAMPSVTQLDHLLRPDLGEATRQWLSIQHRAPYATLKRQVDFVPVELVLCHGASLVVDHRRYGSSTAGGAAQPVPTLAVLFRRPNTSVLAKMANLDGSRANGGKFDRAAGSVWASDRAAFDRAYAVVLLGARRAGVASRQLPDFLAPGWAVGDVLPSL